VAPNPRAYVHRYSLAALSAARHEHELVPGRRVHVHLDAAHMGLGGDDSWSPSVREVSHALTTLTRRKSHAIGTCTLSGFIILVF
jgi:hypothetical protein